MIEVRPVSLAKMPSTRPIRELTKNWSPERLARVAALVAKYEKQMKAAAAKAKRKDKGKRSPRP